MNIDEIVNTFINDLKKTKEYKEAWKTIPYTNRIIFNFNTKEFYEGEYDEPPTTIVMDEEVLLGK